MDVTSDKPLRRVRGMGEAMRENRHDRASRAGYTGGRLFVINGKTMSKISVVVLSLAMVGCASITSESTQLVRVDAIDEEGVIVQDTQCDLANDKGVFSAEAGKHAVIRKSASNLNIICKSDSREDRAEGTAISRAGAGMFGNILFGGAVGAVIDHNRGTAYNYPEWMQVVFGRALIFDRARHESGVPMAGKNAAEVAAEAEARQASLR